METMGRGKQRQRNGLSFIISLISVSIVCVFIGYLMGQYALKMLNSPFSTSNNRSQVNAFNDAVNKQLDDLPQPTANQNTSTDTAANTTTTNTTTTSTTTTSTTTTTNSTTAQSTSLYRVQAGVFSQLANAEALVAKLREAGFEAMITNGPPYRVQTGAFANEQNAQRYAAQLREKGFEAAVIGP